MKSGKCIVRRRVQEDPRISQRRCLSAPAKNVRQEPTGDEVRESYRTGSPVKQELEERLRRLRAMNKEDQDPSAMKSGRRIVRWVPSRKEGTTTRVLDPTWCGAILAAYASDAEGLGTTPGRGPRTRTATTCCRSRRPRPDLCGATSALYVSDMGGLGTTSGWPPQAEARMNTNTGRMYVWEGLRRTGERGRNERNARSAMMSLTLWWPR